MKAGAQCHAGVSDAITQRPCHNRAMNKASSSSQAERQARQANALRRNLARRKQQARDWADQGEAAPEETAAGPVDGHEP